MAQVQVPARLGHSEGPPYASNHSKSVGNVSYFDNIDRTPSEDASELLVFVLNGGPKWGFRIKQLNDNRVIVSRIDRGPAERSGLRVYDEILSVNNVELLDSPRSLLLLDYPDQFTPTQAAANGANAPSSGSLGEKTPLLAVAAAAAETAASASTQASPQFVAAAAAAASTVAAASGGKIELSKLDFAYQLIKHSSASNNNKLVLGVRRFLDFAYARASALAASNMLTAWNFSSSNQYRPSIADLMTTTTTTTTSTTGGWPLPTLSAPQGHLGTTTLQQQQHRNKSHFEPRPTSGRPHTSNGTSNVYKCCDCYCDKGASGQSEDEENERRLIERLKLENQQRQMRQLEQQEQQQRQREELTRQQRQSAAQVTCFHEASLRRQSSGAQQQRPSDAAHRAATSESERADEPAPQVPVRRSSRQTSLQRPTLVEANQVADTRGAAAAPVYSLHHRRLIGLKARGRPTADERPRDSADDDDHADQEGELGYEEEDDDDEEESLPPPPRLHAVGPGVLASAAARPPLPPPPPPPPPMIDSGRRGSKYPPPPPQRTRSSAHQQAPKNIWSPSSSLLASSSLSSEPELELDPAPVVKQEVVHPAATLASTGSETQQRVQVPISQASQSNRLVSDSRSASNEGQADNDDNDDEDEQATVVERHLQAGAANSCEAAAGAANELLLLHQHNEQRADDNNDGATSINACDDQTMARMSAAVASNKKDAGDELPLPLPPPPIEQQQQQQHQEERGNVQLPKGNLRSFSISSPTNLITSQQQQQLTHQSTAARAGAGLSSFVGGPSALGRSSRSPAGHMRSFSIAAPSSGHRAESTKGASQPEQSRRGPPPPRKGEELGGDGGESMQARISMERTLQPQQQQQQRAGRGGAQQQAAVRQDHADGCSRTVTTTADRVAASASASATATGGGLECDQEQESKQNKQVEKLAGPRANIELEMASSANGDVESLLDNNVRRHELTLSEETYQSSKQTTYKTNYSSQKRPQVELNRQGAQQQQTKEEWFKQMYKQMHRPVRAAVSTEKSLLDAVNQAQQRDARADGCIKIKLKSPRSDHHQEPSYFSEEDLERRRSASPAAGAFSGTKPGNISDYLPGHSSISQHERNLLLYHKLIDHINRVFSSVLVQQPQHHDKVEITSRSTNALASLHEYHRARSHSMRRTTSRIRRRSSSGGRPGTLKRRKQLAQSRSGPQTPATAGKQATTCSPAYHIRSTRLNDETTTTTTSSDGGEHERRCVFNRLLHTDGEQVEGLEDEEDDDEDDEEDQPRDPRKQYVAVQQGRDIPLKGLRKPAPQPNIYRDEMFDEKSINIHYKSPASRLLKMNTLNEFELNRIKKFYAQELASRRLQRSKSTRVNTSASAGKSQRYQQQQQRCDLLPPPVRPLRAALDDSSQSTDPIIDLKRYNHALTAKRGKTSAGQRGRGDGMLVARFARAMYDFCAKNEGELSIKRGDLVETLELLAGNQWARVEDCQSGLQGLVPVSYLDYNIGCAVAKRDVVSSATASSRASSRMGGAESHLHVATTTATAADDDPQRRLLAMSKGEPIALIRRLDGHLYEASNTRQATGLVWSNDLDIIKQPPPGAGVAGNTMRAPPASNYADPNFNVDFTDDEAADDGDGEYYENDDDDDDDQEMVRCLRSICRQLDGEGDGRGHHFATLSRARRQQPTSLEHRRRRTRSASGALNEVQQQQQQQRQHHQVHQRAQQFCTISKRQRQQVAAAGSHQRAAQRPLCNCPAAPECSQPAAAVVRSSSSPQIAPLLSVPAHHQLAAAATARSSHASLPRFCRARYAYKPRQRDELELVAGDILVVVQECDDGWLIGHSYTTKQMGTFPGNFVEPI